MGDGYEELVMATGSEYRLYYGSSTGLTTVSNCFPSTYRLMTGADFDRDGYSDVAIRHGSEVRIYAGSSSGISPAPPLKLPSAAHFLDAQGDGNGDGFPDLLAGTKGSVDLYRGGPSGLEAFPSSVVSDPRGSSTFGTLGGWAGDLGGDGFDDLLVGDFLFTRTQVTEGSLFAFKSTGAGFSPIPIWRWGPGVSGARLESAAGIGDVDGDGRPDVAGRLHGHWPRRDSLRVQRAAVGRQASRSTRAFQFRRDAVIR